MAKIKNTKTKKNAIKTKSAKTKSAATKSASSKPKTTASKKKVKKVIVKDQGKKTGPAPKKISSRAADKEAIAVESGKPKKKLSPREEKIQQIRLKLLRQRAALLNEAESALNELPGQTIFPDLGDQATAETDRNFMLRLRGREQRLLKKIDEAIDRIESGSFGICDDCGNEIDVKRLEARPVTTMCIECKTLQEEEERMREQ